MLIVGHSCRTFLVVHYCWLLSVGCRVWVVDCRYLLSLKIPIFGAQLWVQLKQTIFLIYHSDRNGQIIQGFAIQLPDPSIFNGKNVAGKFGNCVPDMNGQGAY
jgi:hypothetical protein